MRAGAAWFALLVVSLPGFASVRGLCCGAGMAKASGCCAAAMTMPGMDASPMVAMKSDGADSSFAAVAECAMGPVREAPEFVVRSEVSFEQDLLAAQGQLPALAAMQYTELSAAAAPPSFFIYKTPPKFLLFDPISVSLRI